MAPASLCAHPHCPPQPVTQPVLHIHRANDAVHKPTPIIQRPDQSLCRLQLAAALVEIQRLRAAHGQPQFIVCSASKLTELDLSAPAPNPRSLPPTARKGYAVDPIGVIAPSPIPAEEAVIPGKLWNYPRISNLGTRIDVLV